MTDPPGQPGPSPVRRIRPYATAVLLSLALIVAVAIAVSLTTGDPDPGTQFDRFAEMDGPLPDLAGPALQGPAVRTADYEGKVVVLNFWASWCAPCRREQPELSAFAAANPDVAVIAVNYRDDEAAATAYLDEFQVAYPSLVDFPGTLLGKLGIPGLPATVIAGPDGTLRFRILGTVDRELLEDLVDRAAS